MTMFAATHASPKTHRAIGTGLARLFTVWSQRQALRKLDKAALSDIGLTRTEAVAESRRAFWDAPESWRC